MRPDLSIVGNTISIERDSDGSWPDWAFEAAGVRLKYVGGTDQWRKPSVRVAYLRVVLDALAAAQVRGESNV